MPLDKKYNRKQIISNFKRKVKWFQKYGTKRIIKYRLTWHIIYEQCTSNVNVKKTLEANIKVFMI
jgi:hypothetical protein